MTAAPEPDLSCRYLDNANTRCPAPRMTRSSYCPAHHRLCYMRRGSRQERREMRRWDRLARAPIGLLRVIADG